MKKPKGGKLFQGKENFQRMNFLYQVAHVALQHFKSSSDLPAYYGTSMLGVAQKSVLKIEPHIKRDLCKGCGNLLKSGVSSRCRVRSGRMICTCLRCFTIKRFPLKRGHRLWIENDKACIETMEVPINNFELEEKSNEKNRNFTSTNSKSLSKNTPPEGISEIEMARNT